MRASNPWKLLVVVSLCLGTMAIMAGCPPIDYDGTGGDTSGEPNAVDDDSGDGGGGADDGDDSGGNDDGGQDSDDGGDDDGDGGADDGDDGDDDDGNGDAPNNPPAAIAGDDQEVKSGAAVTLTGAGDDPDGDTLSYAWEQVSGTAVTLNDATSQIASFTAPEASETLVFELTVSDGELSATDQVSIIVDIPPMLFVALSGGGVVGLADAAAQSGDVPPTTLVEGANSLMSLTTDLAVDANAALLALDFVGAGLLSFNDAPNATGDLAPDRNVVGASTGLFSPTSMAYDPAGDRLFVSDTNGTREVFVFDNVSDAGFTGDVAPSRTITSADFNGGQFWRVALHDDSLYMTNPGDAEILVLDGVAALDGAVAASRTLTNANFSDAIDVFVDGDDNLYVVEAAGEVHRFAGASGLDGAVIPTQTLTVTGAGSLSSIVVDADDVGYIADSSANAIFVFDGISGVSGSLAPDRTISGASTGLSGPYAVYVFDR